MTAASIEGGVEAKVPTAPESLPTAASPNASRSRFRLRSASNAKPARRSPNVVGSAWTPWVRPTQSVSACSRARATSASRYAVAPLIRIDPASTSWSPSAVSSTSEEVSP